MKDKYKTLITSCWVVLLCCFIVKLLGGNFFEIVCENEKFIKFCDFVESNILKYILSFILYIVSSFIYFKAVLIKTTYKHNIILLITLSIWWFIKLLAYEDFNIMVLLDVAYMIFMPIIINRKIWISSIIGFVLTLVFQTISALTKNLSFYYVDEKFIIGAIFTIDYYIMLILYYLYRTKECEKNGINGIPTIRFRRQRKHQ